MLDVNGLNVKFPTEHGELLAVKDFNLSLRENEVYGLVGESGAGKSTVGRAILGLIDDGEVSGEILYNDRDILSFSQQERRNIRGEEIAMIFQEPNSALNPVLTIGQQLRRVVRKRNSANLSKKEETRQIIEALERVQIPDPRSRLKEYPVQFSGGMNQRVMIAMALLCEPSVLIADEPTTALDVTIGTHILELLEEIRQKEDLSIIYITHDMGLVANHCDRVGIMYAGKKVEEGGVNEIFEQPKHPYTRDLLECIPRPDQGDISELKTIEGSMPTPVDLPNICYYANRCEMAKGRCKLEQPELEEVSSNGERHVAACFYHEEMTPT